MSVDLTTALNLTATDLFIGADALYVSMASRQIYKLTIFKEILEKEVDDFNVIEHSLSEFMAFELGEDNANLHVASLCELENQNETL